ncbi:MAG TPA: diacylglycerol kinase family protein [Mycobacteriales bacterium]|nr:diacylglycerol kinase family protein [Mycobacteriales bacterium]
MRALLVVNPKATATSARVRDVLARALGSDLKLDVAETQRRGHAIELGARATQEGYDLVVTLGGDGTVNEVINGILRDAPGGPQTEQPALAVVPGGSTNVFSRALGISRDPVEATSVLLDALREDRSRWIGLGRLGSPGVSDRWFTFTAGMGLDADAVRMVERARAKGRPATPSRYTRATLGRFLFGTDRRHPAITLERPGEEPIPGVFLGIIGNTTPWTYFGEHPITLTTTATFDNGLDLLAMRRFGVIRTLYAASGMLTGHGARGKSALILRDLREFRLVADRPMHVEVDGDYLGEREILTVHSVPAAIRVIC